MTCPVCGTVAVPGARFCHNCGVALPAAASLPTTERRVVTVLFGDLSDFTSWSEDLDPERVGAVTDRVLAALAGAVKTFGGHVDKLTGDGIMAVFGAPVAHEDDAERAVRAALSMQRAVRRVLDDERGGGAPLGLRAGLNTGEVVAGIQAALEYTVIGDTVNTAARLADVAAVGAVYAGATTAAATRRVASWRQLRPLRLKGKREPVEAYELLGLHDAPGTRSGLGDEAPFVGRETEIGRVAGRLAEVIDRAEPRVLVVTAEAGVGKTRFAAEVERFAAGYDIGPGRYAAHGGARVLSVHCAAFGERRRLAPLADLVRTAIGLPSDFPAGAGQAGAGQALGGQRGSSGAAARPVVEERLRRLSQRLGRTAGKASPLATEPLLTLLLGHGESAATQATPTPIGDWPANGQAPEGAGDAVPAAVAELLSALAAEAPLLVVVDDLHDATAETVDALGGTLSRLNGPVLVLLLGRPELVRTAGALTRLADAEVYPLPPLRGADAARLLTSYLGGGRLPQADSDQLLATAQGNPFYLAELVTLLIERGALTKVTTGAGREAPRPGAPTWRLAPGSLGSRLLSRDLAAVLAARIDALPADARAALRDAAVVGDTVPAGVLEAMRERRAGRDGRPSAVVAVELERAVDELLQRRMLHRVRGGFAFATPLMREAAYAGIGKADLADRHAQLARWAAAVSDQPRLAVMPDDERDAFIAEHVERAAALADAVGLRSDAPARAVRPIGVAALGRAARRAVATGEPSLAVEYAERASALAGGALPIADRLVHTRALLQHGRPAEALAYAEKISADAGDDPVIRVRALLVAGRAHEVLGDSVRAAATWQEALAVATEAELPAEGTEAMRRLGMADYVAGRLAEAGNRFGEAYEIAVAVGDRRSQAWSLQSLAWVATARGDFASADAALGMAARLFAELGDPIGRAWLRGTTAFTRLLAGRLAEAQRLARAFLPFGERVGEGWAVGTLRAVAAYAAAELGDLSEADREARRAFRDFAAANDDWGRGFALVVRGAVARGLGELDHAADLLTDALGYCEKTGHPLLIGVARILRGMVALDRGQPDVAEAEARAVLAVVEPHDALPAAQVGPRVLLACARLAHDDAATAAQLLAPIAQAMDGPSLLFSRRQAVAAYARVLLADGRVDEAVEWAQRAVDVPAEDVRGRVVATRVLAEALAAAGRMTDALATAQDAVRLAYATQQASERASVTELLRRLGPTDDDWSGSGQ
ncbi:MAG TPA: adenylate/guanylate cyclase domain-containing protein [Pilimelia sp.]|nr:adenylate/guanylate cyclase domain-containing protein [Pilimelia sp.]